jgi:hypothetical protein
VLVEIRVKIMMVYIQETGLGGQDGSLYICPCTQCSSGRNLIEYPRHSLHQAGYGTLQIRVTLNVAALLLD